MNIKLSDPERQIIAGLLSKIDATKAAAEASINAFGQAVGIVVQNIVRARGTDPKAQYTLDSTGSILVQSTSVQGSDQQ
jgi:hypothetical protein